MIRPRRDGLFLIALGMCGYQHGSLISDEVSSLNVDLNAINKVVFDVENATASHIEEGLKRDEKKLNIEYQDKLDAMAETYAAVLKHYVNSKT